MGSFSRCADNDETLLKGDNNVRTTGWWRREHADHPLTLASALVVTHVLVLVVLVLMLQSNLLSFFP